MQRLVRSPPSLRWPTEPGTWGLPGTAPPTMLSSASGVDARSVSGAASLALGPVVRLGWGAFSAHSFGDGRPPGSPGPRSIPLGRLVPLPTPPPDVRWERVAPLTIDPRPRFRGRSRDARRTSWRGPPTPLVRAKREPSPSGFFPEAPIRIRLNYPSQRLAQLKFLGRLERLELPALRDPVYEASTGFRPACARTH